MKRIKRFGIYQTAKVFAIIYFVVTAVILIPVALILTLTGSLTGGHSPGFPFGGVFFVIIPFIYGLIGFIFTAIGCAVYNLISKYTGGIELEVETTDVG